MHGHLQGPPVKEDRNPVKQKSIDFRELLERLLPLDQLPPVDRQRVQRALHAGVEAQLEQAALFALHQLEQLGALQRIPATRETAPSALRYQSRDGLDIITVQMAGPTAHEGVVAMPRASLPQTQAGLDQLRRLLRLDDPLVYADPPSAQARNSILEQLTLAGRELLGASAVRFVTADADDTTRVTPLDEGLVADAIAQPSVIYFCPDTSRSPRLAAEARRQDALSVAVVGMATGDGQPLGALEVLRPIVEGFSPSDLAIVALLAETCASALERAMRIERLVFVDALTGAYNRSFFDLEMQNEMARARRENASMALCIADIDDFKQFNTAFGYEAGNQVLVQVAQALRRGVRPFDTVSRWGGEEFGILINAPVHAYDVLAICERLRMLVDRHVVRIEGLDRKPHRVGVTVSIGVALYPDHAEDAADLWRVANQALLRAKRPPKNQVVLHRAGGDPRAHAR